MKTISNSGPKTKPHQQHSNTFQAYSSDPWGNRHADSMATYPGAVAGVVVALQKAVDECAAAALDQGGGVAQLQQPAPEAATGEGPGGVAYLLQRDT